jgi:proline iminopeptidase
MMYPPIDPYASGLLNVPDGNEVYWETAGDPEDRLVAARGTPGKTRTSH